MIASSLSSNFQLFTLPPPEPRRRLRHPTAASSSLSLQSKRPNLQLLSGNLSLPADSGHVQDASSTPHPKAEQVTDLAAYSLLLKSCIRHRDLARGRALHRHLVHSGVELDSVACNSLIALYSKCGEWETASSLFHEMGEKRDLVSWSAMISCFAHNGMEAEAIELFWEMMGSGFCPNEFCYSSVIRACCCGEYGWVGIVVFGLSIKSGFFRADVCVGCALIDLFAKCEDLELARRVFDQMPERNVVTWTLMITRYGQQGFAKEGVELFVKMCTDGFDPDQFTMSSVVSACAELGSFELGQQLHSRAVKSGFASDVCVGCSFIDMYAKSSNEDSIIESRKVFDRMNGHNVQSWTSIITGYVQNGERDIEALGLFCEMLKGNARPNQFTYSSILKACANISDSDIGEQIYSHVVKAGLASVNCVGNSFVSMYARAGRVEDARKAFNLLFEKNLISYNAIFDGYSKNYDLNGAFELLYEVEGSKVGVSPFTFSSLLSAAASVESMDKGQQLHARVLKGGLQSDQGVSNALVSMYSRCGNIKDAWVSFTEMENRNVISWTSVIAGFAKHGHANRALALFDEMIQSGVRPNEATFVSVLSACSHVGMVRQGWEYFYSMSRDYGLVPKMDHYACIVDMLGRSGCLKEAVEFIYSMPSKANALVWRTLLGACRVHSNMVLGEQAAKKILELEPHDSASHVLLSNLYASTSRWDDVAEIRRNMKQRCLSKEAGLSWIEVNNKIHRFFVGDTRHPLAREIYTKLDELALEIKKVGYVPDLNFVLHEVKEENKEQYLFQHSEKIAVAFGLISTSSPRPIRIFKNLRVCGDCHNAIKFITKTTGRVVVLRDSNRFHCIKDGVCSCGDYW